MCALWDLGVNTPVGRAYTEEEILAKVLKGKQRGYIAGRGRVLAGSGSGAGVREASSGRGSESGEAGSGSGSEAGTDIEAGSESDEEAGGSGQ